MPLILCTYHIILLSWSSLILIWFYTNKSGIKTIVWTDVLQSLFLITVIIITIWSIKTHCSIATWYDTGDPSTSTFQVFDWDINPGTHFLKQFISGLLITVALVGLDQSMMQKDPDRQQMPGMLKRMTFSFSLPWLRRCSWPGSIDLYLRGISSSSIGYPGWQNTTYRRIIPLIALHHLGSVGIYSFPDWSHIVYFRQYRCLYRCADHFI